MDEKYESTATEKKENNKILKPLILSLSFLNSSEIQVVTKKCSTLVFTFYHSTDFKHAGCWDASKVHL